MVKKTDKSGKVTFEPDPVTLEGLTTKDGKVWRDGNIVSDFEIFYISEKIGPLYTWLSKLPQEPEHLPRIKWMTCDKKGLHAVGCGWNGEKSKVLRAPNPFISNKTLYACPNCKRTETLKHGCNVDGCDCTEWVGGKCFGHHSNVK